MKVEPLSRTGLFYAIALVAWLNLHAWSEYWDVFPWLPKFKFLAILHWAFPILGILLLVPFRWLSRLALLFLLVLQWFYLVKFGQTTAPDFIGLVFTIIGIWLFSRSRTWRQLPAA